MSNAADHKPSERHTVDEVLKSLQDLIRNEALDDGKPKAPPAPAEPAEPRKRGRPRKVVIPDAAAPANPRRRSSASLSDELNNVLASLNDLVNTDLDGSSTPKKPAAPPAVAGKPISSETAPAPSLARGPRLDPSDDLQAAADALAATEEPPADSADTVAPSFEDMAESAEEIVAAPPPPEEPAAAEAKPAPVEMPTPPAAPKKQLELKVLEPGEWKEPEPTSSPSPKPAARASTAAAKPSESKKPAAKAGLSPAKSRPSPPPTPSTSALAPTPAAPAPVAKPVTPVTSPDDVDMIDLDQADAVTDLVVSGNTDTVEATPREPSSAKPAQTQRADDASELEQELTLEDPTRRSTPTTPVIDQEREKELHSLGLAEIDFSQVPETSAEQFAAFSSSALPPGDSHAVELDPDGGGRSAAPSRAGRPVELGIDDNIPLLEDEVTLPPPAPGLDPHQIRELAVRAIARLNIEMRKAGEPGLDVKTIQRLQALLREELEKAGNPGENTRPK